ncbi:MAG: heat-inducible transcriptional repressor HrcA [Brevefilum sp.]|nr:heat-inducible transcriptional repressor HrcA [Brevefilum sp.]MDT8382654.1 heat-inducible transcriptional repressor HrcA [Brevefilum sp.]MDW7754017.1 heat-inducible transcriptional repressor HrcA [Brevefilum sp.]
MQLTDRQKLILTLIIHEHIRTAQPVGSKSLVEKYNLAMSSATVRNEMSALTDYELLRQPHTSAGRVPTEEGYRFFVGNLVQKSGLPTNTRRTITHQFYQSRQDIEQWLRLAASVLANQSQAASLVTAPHAEKAIFKHLELIATRGRQVLMVLVLMGGEIRQQFISLSEPVSQDRLSVIAAQISNMCTRCDVEKISRMRFQMDSLGKDILDILIAEMTLIEESTTGEIYLDGMTNVLSEPEFAESDEARQALHILEERSLLENLLASTVMNTDVGGIQVLIGGEGTWQELRQCSIVLARYGDPNTLTGSIGVLGPIRMPYDRTISTVRFVANVLSDLVTETLAV